jgi:hypothetical protein
MPIWRGFQGMYLAAVEVLQRRSHSPTAHTCLHPSAGAPMSVLGALRACAGLCQAAPSNCCSAEPGCTAAPAPARAQGSVAGPG